MKWVKHDTDANQDAKLQNVLLDYGLDGYGLYWYCIELIANKVDKDNITFDLEHDARIISRNTGSTTKKVEEMMRYFVKVGLFEDDNGIITCTKLAKRLDKSMTSNPEMRIIIQRLKSHDPIMTPSAKPMQDKIRIELKEVTTEVASFSIEEVDRGFDYFWDVWRKCKKSVDVKNTSPKEKTLKNKWKPLFNSKYRKENSLAEFKTEVNKICEFAKKAHAVEGFNKFTNMETGKFFTDKQWRD